MEYWAHSASGVTGKVQQLREHLPNVGLLCRKLGEDTRPGDKNFAEQAEWAGALHDLGKYQDKFQKRIRGQHVQCPHAVHGAAFLGSGILPSISPRHSWIAGIAIAGHHAGLPDVFAADEHSFLCKTKQFREEAVRLVEIARADSFYLDQLLKRKFPALCEEDVPGLDLRERMLFSCLVDADRLDSAGRSWNPIPLDAEAKLNLLRTEIAHLSTRRMPSNVADARSRVQQDCVAAASFPGSLFSLTVPTGGGKTLAAMTFALERAAAFPERYRRVIVVIPYLSIIEQTADVYRRIFGDKAVLEHHSGAAIPLRAKRMESEEIYVPVTEKPGEFAGEDNDWKRQPDVTENWDAPLIVTTSVRFFESLFSNRPADLRRVHNVARSIVVLDEVQTLPVNLVTPLLKMIEELSRDWGCTFVFSTATQPAFEKSARLGHDERLPQGSIREIVQQPQRLYTMLNRVKICWQIEQPTPWEEIARKMLAEKQALCVVNLRDHASVLYDHVLRLAKEVGSATGGIYHLSTRMCGAHRLRVIDAIKNRLAEKKPCRVISTQLVEAGVDIDFPLVMRALAPLDSIIQAAGRADREGRITAELGQPGGRVIVFRSEDDKVPRGAYREATDVAKRIALEWQGEGIQVDSTEALALYYERYYGDRDLGIKLQQMRTLEGSDSRRGLAFATLAEQFEMIGNRTRDVYVPDDKEGEQLLNQLRKTGFMTLELRRALQRHSVGLQPYEFEKAKGVISKLADNEIWIAGERSYDPVKGLRLELASDDFIV